MSSSTLRTSRLLSGESCRTRREVPLFNRFISGPWYGPRIDIGTTGMVLNPPQVIATNTFFVLFLRVEFKRYALWLVMFSQWSLIGAIIIAGPATTSGSTTGPFCEQPSYDSCFFTRFDDHLQTAFQAIGVGYLRTMKFSALCACFISLTP